MREYFVEMLVAIVVIVGISTVGSCTIHANAKVTEMTLNGVDPLHARCTIWGGDYCDILAAKEE